MKKLLFLLFFMISANVVAASFNCSKASTALEKTICDNGSLSKADSTMGKLYFSIRKKLSDYETKVFKQEHKKWLKARSIDCKPTDISCLLDIYNQRIEILSNRNSILISALESLLGVYHMRETDDCNLEVNILKDNTKYMYKISTTERKADGLLTLSMEGKNVYLHFKGLLADDPPVTVSGAFLEGMVVIQNYGNSMNQYTTFSECGPKYLELLKK